jgi:hypothetical protein
MIGDGLWNDMRSKSIGLSGKAMKICCCRWRILYITAPPRTGPQEGAFVKLRGIGFQLGAKHIRGTDLTKTEKIRLQGYAISKVAFFPLSKLTIAGDQRPGTLPHATRSTADTQADFMASLNESPDCGTRTGPLFICSLASCLTLPPLVPFPGYVLLLIPHRLQWRRTGW